MFQSIMNIFDSSSNSWNIEQLQKVLKIPQDQQEILDNIPGWTTAAKSTIKDKTNTPVIKKTNESSVKSQFISEKVNSKQIISNIPIYTHLTNLKKNSITNDVHIDKTLTFPNKKRQSSLVRSFSLSSLNKLTTAFSNRVLKRSSSTSTINTDLSYNFNLDSNNPEKMSSIIHSVLKEPYNKMLLLSSPRSFNSAATMDIHTEFTNSAVQCQMSQCSQSEFENNENIVIPTQTMNSQIKISTAAASAIDSNISLDNNYEIGVGSPKPIIDDRNGNLAGSSNELKKFQNVTKTIESDVPVADVEESFISQPIPCAQPLLSSTTSVLKNIDACSAQNGTGSFEIKAIPNMKGKVMQNICEKTNVATKRKRKNKQEKLPKKLRNMKTNEIEILYSSDQIRNMIKIAKLLTDV